MPAHKLLSTRVEQATREKVLRAHTGRLLLIVLFGSFLMLTYGYTAVHSDELPAIKLAAQVDSLESTPQPTARPHSQPLCLKM